MINEKILARALGALSLVLGAVYLAVPRRFSEWIGVRSTDRRAAVVALVGLRELGPAFALLANRRPGLWLVARVIGDVMDFVLLAAAAGDRTTRRSRLAAAAAALGGVTLVDGLAAGAMRIRQKSTSRGAEDALRVRKAITVRRPRQDVYRFWREFENLPRFMVHLEQVEVIDDRRSHWKAKAPLGRSVEWDAEIVEDQPDALIAWRTLAKGNVKHSGRVRFEEAPQDYGTEVHVELDYAPPGGALGALTARVAGEEPSQQVDGDLRRFKQLLETGEVVQSEGSLGERSRAQRPAQPARADELGAAS